MNNLINPLSQSMNYFIDAIDDIQAWEFLKMANQYKDHTCHKDDCMICEAWSLKP